MKYSALIFTSLLVFSVAFSQGVIGERKRPSGWMYGITFPYHSLSQYSDANDGLPVNLPNSSWQIIDAVNYPLSPNPRSVKKSEGWWLQVKSLRDGGEIDLIFKDKKAMEVGQKLLYGGEDVSEEDKKEMVAFLRKRITERDAFLTDFLQTVEAVSKNQVPPAKISDTMTISATMAEYFPAEVPIPARSFWERWFEKKKDNPSVSEKAAELKKARELQQQVAEDDRLRPQREAQRKIDEQQESARYAIVNDRARPLWREPIKDVNGKEVRGWEFINSQQIDNETAVDVRRSDGVTLRLKVANTEESGPAFQQRMKSVIDAYQAQEQEQKKANPPPVAQKSFFERLLGR